MNKFFLIIIFSFSVIFVKTSQAQESFYPNELEGYRFFSMEKIKELRLAISSRDDVVRIFGEECETICEYSDDWRIIFTYFDHISKGSEENGVKITLVPDAKYRQRLYEIRFVPKKRISFEKAAFPEPFSKSMTVGFGHDFSGKASSAFFDIYSDSNGLRYMIFKAEGYTTFDKKDERLTGDLVSIEYFIPKIQQEKMFVKERDKWKSIILLQSTKAEIENLLGKPKKNVKEYYLSSLFNVGNGEIKVNYSRGFCTSNQDGGWNVADDVVTSMIFFPDDTFPKFNELKIDRRKYRKVEGSGSIRLGNPDYYQNSEEGITYTVEKERVQAIQYFPAKNYRHLKCSNLNK